MLNIIIATHGPLAPALLSSAAMVYGSLPAVATLSLTEEGGINAFREEFAALLQRQSQGVDGVLVLCDMECGTPYNVACQHAFDPGRPVPLAVVTGVNFPMLLMSADWLDSTDVHAAAAGLAQQALETMRVARPAQITIDNDEF